MKLSPSSTAALNEALCKISALYSGEEDQLLSTDFYFMPTPEGCLHVYNDNDEEIACADVPEWKEYQHEEFYAKVEADLHEAIKAANGAGALGSMDALLFRTCRRGAREYRRATARRRRHTACHR